MQPISRRNLLHAAGAVPLLAAANAATAVPAPAAETTSNSSAFDYQHVPQPLPFKVDGLNGFSGRLMQSHWENNYGGAVKALNAVRARLHTALQDAELPPYVYNGLKREHLMRTGSVILHEYYFGNLGGDGKPSAATRTHLGKSFGSFDTWEAEFRRIALGLGGSSGWVMLGFNPPLRLLENYWMADHATAPAGVVPVLVLDLYEHSYQMDFGAATTKYVDAFFSNIQWDAVESRLTRV